MKSLCYSVFIVLSAVCFAFGASADYAGLFNYLEEHYPPGYKETASVKDVYQDMLVFSRPVKKPSRGQEMLVLEKKESGAAFSVKAVIKVKSMLEDEVSAKVVKKFAGRKVKPGDPVAFPAAPKIYLKTGMENKYASSAYNRLLKSLISRNYDVSEISDISEAPESEEYSLLVNLEKTNKHCTVKINSVYTGSTLFYNVSAPYKQAEAEKPEVKTFTREKAPEPEPVKEKQESPRAFKETKPKARFSAKIPEDKEFASTTEYRKNELRLSAPFIRVVAAELDGSPPQELVFLGQKGVFAFSLDGRGLSHIDSYSLRDPRLFGLHLHCLDIDSDGRDEIFATCAKKIKYMDANDTALSSIALDWKKDNFVVLCRDIPFYLRAIHSPEGKKILLGQRKKGEEQYYGRIFRVNWNQAEKTLTHGPVYKPAADIHSLYQFVFASGSDEKVLILEPDSHVSLYRLNDESLLDMTDVSFGKFTEIPYHVRLAEKTFKGGFNEEITSKKVFAPRRMLLKKEFQDQCFLIKKERSVEDVKDKVINFITRKSGMDSIIAAQCSGDNVYQSWKSEQIPRDIIDFTFFEQNSETNLLGLVRDSRGYGLEFLSARED